MKKLPIAANTAAWLAVLAVIVLSMVPGSMRPHVLQNDYAEHFLAYFICGSLFAIGYQRPVQLLLNAVLLATCAASLEVIQLWIPGRTASVSGFEISAIGAWIGLMAVVFVRRARAHRFVATYK